MFCVGGITWFAWNLLDRHQQIQQIQQSKQANNLLAQKQYSLAIEAYDRLIAENLAEDSSIWISRGYAFLGLNQHRDMLQSCSTAVSLESRSALAWNCQGEALYYLQQPEAALEALEKATSLEPGKATFWLNKARISSDLAQNRQAIAASEAAIRSSQPSEKNYKAIALNLKGQNLLKLRQYQQALVAFEQSLSYSPKYLFAQQGRGIALYELGNYQQAVVAFEQTLNHKNLTKQIQSASLLYLGVSLCQLQKVDLAEQAFASVLALAKDEESRGIARKGCGIQ